MSDLRNIEQNNIATDAMQAMCETYLELNKSGGEFELDPFSQCYSQAAMELYKKISGVKSYDPAVNELTSYIDPSHTVRSPSPYPYGDSKVVGDFVSSWGWILQALNVKVEEKVLEYGAGEGQISIMLARMGIDVTVIDIDERYLECIHAQAESLGINVTLKKGKFGDGYKSEKFDRILFFEAFHHAFEHVSVVKALKNHLSKDGFIVFSGEPIVAKSSEEALFIPFPWGPRLDGLSVLSMNKHGWCELGFQQDYFVEMLMRSGFLVTFLPCPVTMRGNCYIAKLNDGRVNLGDPYLLSISDRDCGWHQPEGTHRWTKKRAYLTLPDDFMVNGGHVTIALINYFLNDREVTIIGEAGQQKTVNIPSGDEYVASMFLQGTRFFEIYTPQCEVPKETIENSLDERELGIAVAWYELK